MDMHVIFYPSGYLQLQVSDDGDDFCHIYDNAEHIAKDADRLLKGDNAIGWYGNDPDAWLEISQHPEVRVVAMDEIVSTAKSYQQSTDKSTFWDNQQAFFDAIVSLQK